MRTAVREVRSDDASSVMKDEDIINMDKSDAALLKAAQDFLDAGLRFEENGEHCEARESFAKAGSTLATIRHPTYESMAVDTQLSEKFDETKLSDAWKSYEAGLLAEQEGAIDDARGFFENASEDLEMINNMSGKPNALEEQLEEQLNAKFDTIHQRDAHALFEAGLQFRQEGDLEKACDSIIKARHVLNKLNRSSEQSIALRKEMTRELDETLINKAQDHADKAFKLLGDACYDLEAISRPNDAADALCRPVNEAINALRLSGRREFCLMGVSTPLPEIQAPWMDPSNWEQKPGSLRDSILGEREPVRSKLQKVGGRTNTP